MYFTCMEHQRWKDWKEAFEEKEAFVFVVRCAIWYHLYNLKNVKNTHGGVFLLVKLQASVCNFTKINTPSWVFFTFFKLHKYYQIAQRITFIIWSICQTKVKERKRKKRKFSKSVLCWAQAELCSYFLVIIQTGCSYKLCSYNPLLANTPVWSNTLKQFVDNSRQITWVCLTILWGWHLECTS